MAGTLKRLVYKEVLPGDLRKARGESNDDAAAGGGARDLRLRPWDGHFENVERPWETRAFRSSAGRDLC